jgi:integrase
MGFYIMPRLSESLIARTVVPAGKRDVMIFDSELPGFGVRVFESGKASCIVKFAVGGKQRKLTLGKFAPGTLKDMRAEASRVLAKARLGEDVVEKKRAATAAKAANVGDLIKRYLKDRKGELRSATYSEQIRYLTRYWEPLHGLAVDRVTRRDVVLHVDRIAEERGKVTSDRARSALSAFYSWAIDKSLLDTSPCIGIRRRSTNGARSRVLSEAELVTIWNACGADDIGRILKLLILTAQRKTEISDLQWSEIDFGRAQIMLPPERTKNKREHLVPLSAPALSILDQVPHRFRREYLFGEGVRGFVGWDPAKTRLDKSLPKMQPWVLHDIRRSVITHLNERGFAQPHVIEAIANHISGSKAGVAGIYNRSVYAAEKRQALEKWGEHLSSILQKSEGEE